MAQCELATDIVRCAVLMLLYERPCHGYALMELLQARLGKAVSPAIIYPFLTGLSKSGYLTSNREKIGKRTRIHYSMTPKGRTFAEGVFKRLSQIVSTAIESNSLHCAQCGCKLYEPGHVEEINGRPTAFCCLHCAIAHKEEKKKALKSDLVSSGGSVLLPRSPRYSRKRG